VRSAKCIEAGKAPIEAVVFPSDTAAQLAIKAGIAEASLNDAASLAFIAKTVDGGNAFDFIVYSDFENPRFPLGVALPKESAQLRDALQAALKELVDDGTYAKIMEKYDLKALRIEKITVNAAID